MFSGLKSSLKSTDYFSVGFMDHHRSFKLLDSKQKPNVPLTNVNAITKIYYYLVIGDGDLVLLAGALVAGGHVQDTVGVNVKGNLQNERFRLFLARCGSQSKKSIYFSVL